MPANLPNLRRFSLKNLNPFFEPTPEQLSEPIPERAPDLQPTANPEPTSAPIPPDLITLADLQPQPIDWLWPQRLAVGTLALLSGQPGAGKTWVALALAAHLSRGRAPYTGESLPPCTTLYVSTEHDGAQIIHPRFAALHGDPDRLVVLRSAPERPAQPSEAQQSQFLNQLDDALECLKNSNPAGDDVRLVILDPIETLFGPTIGPDSAHPDPAHPDPIDRLRRLAEHHHCCILLVRHLPRQLRRAGPGRPMRQRNLCDFSHAFRTEFLAGATPDEPTQPALLHIKSNLGPLMPGLSYSITADGFRFTGLSQSTPQDLLADRPTGAGLPLRKFAGNWLRQQLADGSKSQGTLEIAAERDGITIRTLKRARFDLGVISEKDGMKGCWFWSLPYNPGEHENN